MSSPRNRKGRRLFPNGRNKGVQYTSLSYDMLQSDAWRTLGASSVKVMMELRTRFNGYNNGKISLSFEDAAKSLGLGKATIHRAFKELEAKGFIRLIQKGYWYGRMASEWAITDKPFGKFLSTNDWKLWRKPQK